MNGPVTPAYCRSQAEVMRVRGETEPELYDAMETLADAWDLLAGLIERKGRADFPIPPEAR